MSIGVVSKQGFQAISSGLDSIATGISNATQTGGVASLKDSLQLFGQSPRDPLSSPRDPASKEIAQSGQLSSPANFFTKLPAVQWGDPHAAESKISSSELADKLKTGNFDFKQGIDDLKKSFEEKLNTVGDDAQLANVDLQNILQKQQQTLQMMSNISKMATDTANAIIRKIGG